MTRAETIPEYNAAILAEDDDTADFLLITSRGLKHNIAIARNPDELEHVPYHFIIMAGLPQLLIQTIQHYRDAQLTVPPIIHLDSKNADTLRKLTANLPVNIIFIESDPDLSKTIPINPVARAIKVFQANYDPSK